MERKNYILEKDGIVKWISPYCPFKRMRTVCFDIPERWPWFISASNRASLTLFHPTQAP